MMIPAGQAGRPDDREDRAGARSRRHPDRRRQLVVRGHAAARSRAAADRASTTSAAACRAARKARATARRSCRAARQSRGRRSRTCSRRLPPRTDAGPCVTHVGADGAGHFVKMVHNGIEYGDMQLIAESWDVLRRGLGMSAPETADVFDELEPRPARVVPGRAHRAGLPHRPIRKRSSRSSTSSSTRPDRRAPGRWTTQVALDLGVSVPTIAAALDARGHVQPQGPAGRGVDAH